MLKYSKTIFFTSVLSLLICIYTEITKRRLESDKNFTPFCDFETQKCSNVLLSKYSVGFGFDWLPEALKISNSLYGIFFYAVIASLSKQTLKVEL